MNFEKFLKIITNYYIYNYPLHFHGKKYIFIHINKTGGTSISRSYGFPSKLHLTAHEIYNQVGQRNWVNAFKFSFVRNPFDKVLSHFRYRVYLGQLKTLNLNSNDFNIWVENTYGILLHNTLLDPPKMFQTHFNWLSINNETIDVDFCGRFENYEQDFKKICKEIGFKNEPLHLNKISLESLDYRNFYTDQSRKIIEKYFIKDLNLFNYSF